MFVSAKRIGSKQVNMCDVATIAADYAARVLNTRGGVPQRSTPLMPASLANHDACRLLDAATLSGIPGIDAAHPEAGFAGWDCHWRSTITDASIQLRFDQLRYGQDPPLTAEDGQPTQRHGRTAFIEPNGDGDGTCLARVVHWTYPNAARKRTAELLFLVVTGTGPIDKLCDQAADLVTAAAAKLPRN